MSVWKQAIVPIARRVTGVSIRPSAITTTNIAGTTNKAFHPYHHFRLSICSRSINHNAKHAPSNSSKDENKNQLTRDTTPEDNTTLDPRLSEWIPPERPLVGDKGFSHLYKKDQVILSSSPQQQQQLTEEEELKLIEQEVKLLEDEAGLSAEEQLKRIEQELKIIEAQDEAAKKKAAAAAAAAAATAKKRVIQPQRNQNWLQTRQEKLGDDYLTPTYDRPGQELPVLHHTLLTAQEIMAFLSSLGGMDLKLVHDQVMNEHGDTRLGGAFRGIVFVSGNSSAHARMIANSLVDQMKRRKLQEVGVMGARHGAAGSDDASETWFSIDCHNFIVNIMDEPTRRMLNLEEWWSQADPMAEVNALHLSEEDAMDEFVARNPVPPDYGRNTLMGSSSASNWSNTISDLQHKRWTVPHRAVVQRPTSNRGRKKKAKGKRR